MPRHAEHIYDALVALMDDAAQGKDHLRVTKAAEQHGLTHQHMTAKGFALADAWRLVDSSGVTVSLTYTMQDTSWTLEAVGPDVNRLRLSLVDTAGNLCKSYEVTYYN